MISNLKDTYRKYERWVPIAAFLLGFLFDAFMLRRIDELKVILQQAVYLFIAGLLIGIELLEEAGEIHPPGYLRKIWKYRESVLHFLLGTLLNSYTIFYFKSASAFSSFIFIFLLVALLTLNEFKRFGESQTQVHSALLSLCLISYFISLSPTILGFIGVLPFLCAVVASIVVYCGFYFVMKSKLATKDPHLLKTHLIFPFASVQSLFVVLYFAHLIPPVPLSVRYMGIYHGIEKTQDGYALSYTRSPWKFWQHGDQTFQARPGDVIYCYAQVFSPTRFKDELQVRWLYHDERRGWLRSDAIPMPVLGGRDEGYRIVTKKVNFQPGEWRVQVETRDDREIGSIGFHVEPDETSGERALQQEVR
jgi:hypothetical protein